MIQLSGKPETVIWNSCLKELAQSDSPNDAIRLFSQLYEYDVCLDAFTFSFLIKACTKLSGGLDGRIIHGFIEKLGFQYNLFLQNSLVHLYAVYGEINDASLLFDKMPERDIVTWNIMITQLVRKGNVDGAYGLFDRMPERNVRSWTSMIMGFVQCGKPKEAIDLFTKMEEEKLCPNEVTVVAVLAACADLGALDLGQRIHEFSNRSGFKSNVRICNTLIDMYIKCGCLEAARTVFEDMEQRTIVSWSAMIQGLAINGNGDEALKLFNEMIQLRIKPNAVTFIGLLHACSHMGMVNEGRKYFTSMSKDYGIVPRIEHYGCMVDLLSRAGLLKEAREFIKNMPIKPNGVVCGALLGGCRVHKNLEMAEEAIEHLLELDPLNDGYYVVLSNVYAEAKRWEDVARVRKLMRDNGVKKTPGASSISVDGVLHEFVAGDDTHPQCEAIKERWEKLLEEMRLKGYVPDTSVILLDIDENEKVKFLFGHSEKLAVVFGLINTSNGTPIRIMKNLRVCEDCHAALKLISEITDREIVVRDRSRLNVLPFFRPRLGLDYGLHPLNVDDDVLEMAKYVKDNKIILVYVKHGSSNVDSSIFVTPKKGDAIAVDNHLRKALIEIDSSLDPASSVKGPIIVKSVDLFDDLDEILGDYANTGEEITRDEITGNEITGKQMIVHVGNRSTVDDVFDLQMLFETEGVCHIRKFNEVKVDADNESKEKNDTKYNDTSGSDSRDLDYDPKHDEAFDDDDEHIVKMFPHIPSALNIFSFNILYRGTTVRIDVQQEPNPDSPTRTFRRVYVCLGSLKQGFRACGREILGLDGCFMSGPWPGQILTTVGVDANNGLYLVAYAIVEAESKASWCWFLNLLGEDLGHQRRGRSHMTRLQVKGVHQASFLRGRSVKCSKCGNLGHNRKGCRGHGGASQVGASQAVGARNVSSQADGSRNASSQAAGSSQPSATPSTSTGVRNLKSSCWC
nr:pentatricopeptide repeat-containing protein At5g66520-like [Tanacetum cinerariifolium]